MSELYSNSDHLIVNNGSSAVPWFHMHEPNRAHPGDVVYDPSNGCLKVWDGCMWHDLRSCDSIDMHSDTEMAVNWAKQKMREENQWDEIAANNLAVEKALARFKEAEEQLRVVVALSQKVVENEYDDDDTIPF